MKHVPVGTGVLDGPKVTDKANVWSNKNMLGYDRIKNRICFVQAESILLQLCKKLQKRTVEDDGPYRV